MIDYSYLTPPHQARKIRRLKQYQFETINGKPCRRIFENVEYTPQEKQQIENARQYIKQKEPEKDYPDSLILKMIYLSQSSSNPLNVYENLKRHNMWFEEPLICNSNRIQGRKILMEGVFYSYGRDEEYSPVIYVYPCQVDTSKYSLQDYCNALYMLLCPIQEFMLIPGIIESYNIVIDMENKSFHLPMGSVRQVIQKAIFAYPFRLKRLFCVNTSSHNEFIKGTAELLKNHNYHIRPEFISNYSEFRRYIPDQEREQKYGGNLENLHEFWPISLASKYEQEKSYYLVERTSETDFESVINDEVFFESVEEEGSGCGFCHSQKCTIF